MDNRFVITTLPVNHRLLKFLGIYLSCPSLSLVYHLVILRCPLFWSNFHRDERSLIKFSDDTVNRPCHVISASSVTCQLGFIFPLRRAFFQFNYVWTISVRVYVHGKCQGWHLHNTYTKNMRHGENFMRNGKEVEKSSTTCLTMNII